MIRTTLRPSSLASLSFETGDTHEPLSKAVGDGLFELRHLGKLNTRILWFFAKGQRIILVDGIRNKSQAIPARDKRTALERMRDWRKRAER